jgi:hypothetical protein
MENLRIIQSTPVVIYSRKSARTERRPAFGSAKHVHIGLIFGGLIKQLKEALIVMRVDYTLR